VKAALTLGFVGYLHGSSLVFLIALTLFNFALSRCAAGYFIACVPHRRCSARGSAPLAS
jgi:hypothetical protein